MKRTMALLIAAVIAQAAVPVASLAQDRDRDRDDRRERREDRRDDDRRERVRDMNRENGGGCVYSRTLPNGQQVFRCETAPGRYVDRVVPN